jgi:hypothetical protein
VPVLYNDNSIHFAEEWEYLLRKQVDPKLDESMAFLKAQDQEAYDWAMLYFPMAKYLFGSYSRLLGARKRQLCLDILTCIDSNGDVSNALGDSAAMAGIDASGRGISSENDDGMIDVARITNVLRSLQNDSSADHFLGAATEVRVVSPCYESPFHLTHGATLLHKRCGLPRVYGLWSVLS